MMNMNKSLRLTSTQKLGGTFFLLANVILRCVEVSPVSCSGADRLDMVRSRHPKNLITQKSFSMDPKLDPHGTELGMKG
jgi:hypothetical protein